MSARLAIVGAAASVAVFAAAPAQPLAAPPDVSSLVPLSGQDVAAGCAPATPPQADRSQVYPKDTAVESHLAVDPRDPSRIAAAWMQDFSKAHVVAASRDGGRSWERSVPPGTAECTGGPEGLPFDPWLAWAGDGTLYMSGMRLILGPLRTTPDNAVVVNRSQDGGRTWSDAVVAVRRDGFNDHPTIAVDPDRPQRLYLAWQVRREPFGSNSPGAYLKISEDGGRSWSPTQTIYTPPRAFYTIFGGVVAAAPGGRVAFMFGLADNQNALPGARQLPLKIIVVSSADGGRTWSEGTTVAEQASFNDSRDPDSGEVAVSGLPGFVASPRGEFLLTWHDVQGEGEQQTWRVLLSSSPDAVNWREPRDVTPPGPAQILLPQVAGTRGGRVAITWYDTAPDRRGDSEFTAQARIAIAQTSTAPFEQTPVGQPFDLRRAYKDVRNGARFLGDYVGLTGKQEHFLAAMPFAPPVAQVGQVQIFGVAAGPNLGQTRVSVTPRTARRDQRTRLRVRVTRDDGLTRAPVARALVLFEGRRARTRTDGVARLTVTPRRRGRHPVRVKAPGEDPPPTYVRVR